MANKNYQYLTNFNSPNYTSQVSVPAVYGRPRTITGFTYHWWGDPNQKPTFEGIVSWLTRPNGNTSAHYVLEAGRVACIVAPYDAAWHTGNALGNASTLGIELNPRASAGDYTTAAQFSAQLIDAFGDQLKYGHSDWSSTQCPGAYDINRIDRESYTWISGADWGDVTAKGATVPPKTPAPEVPAPLPTPPVTPEWVLNLKDINDVKLTVLPAEGARRVNLITHEQVEDVIPKGTVIDIAKETTVAGKKYYISSWSAQANAAIGIPAGDLGVPVTPPTQEKPEWLKNLSDITDQDFWTRSEAPVLNLEDGKTVKHLPINSKVRVTHTTTIVGTKLMVLEGGKEAIEVVYLNDKELTDPYKDLEARVGRLEGLWKAFMDFIVSLKDK